MSPSAPQYTSAGTYLKTKRAVRSWMERASPLWILNGRFVGGQGAIMLSWAKATNNGYDYSKKTVGL